MNIGVFCPNWVGDLLMATPALRAIRSAWPSARITAVLRPPLTDVLAGTGLVDECVEYRPTGTDPRQRGWGFVGELRARRFDVAILFPNSFRSAWQSWTSGAKRRFGIVRNGRGILLTDPIDPPPNADPVSALDEYWRIAREVTARLPMESVDVVAHERGPVEAAVSPADNTQFDAACDSLGIPLRDRSGFVCLNPGGAFGAAKHWPVEYFAKLARRLVDQRGSRVIVLCGPAEREQARSIASQSGSPRVHSLADVVPSIGLTKAAIARAQLLVSTDSGPRHFAPAFGVPVVSLFGPTHIGWSDTHYPHETQLQVSVPCGPCQQRTCPLTHHRCMTELTVEKVWDGITGTLQKAA